MKEIITRDGSITFWNEKYNEAYHSKTVGALEEAMIKYVEPADLKEGDIVLDFCFGLGYNSLAAISKIKKLRIIGIENDSNIIKKNKEIEVPDEFKEKNKIIIELTSTGTYLDDNYDLKIIIGDAKEEIKKMKLKFNAVLFDPFSPKVCPELWTQEIFDDIAKLMKPNARLTTYSCATHVRSKLQNAGFTILDGPCFGRKSPSTVAIYKK